MYHNFVKAYQQTQFLTANPLRLILMCYEGAINSLKTAKEYYLAKEYEKKARELQKTLNILHELMQSLDFEKGGQIANNLRSLYQYLLQRIIEGDLKQDMTAFDEAISHLDELAVAWRNIAAGDRTTAVPPMQPFIESVNNKASLFRSRQV
jgi:flagellar protein FliS